MTLIISEITPFGIAMVADTTYNFKEMMPSGAIGSRVLNGARKLQYIPYLNAGISMWGTGRVKSITGEIFTDLWVEDLIRRYQGIDTLESFASALREELERAMGQEDRPLGFHLAGYEEQEGHRWPAFFHVRNCEGDYASPEIHDFVLGREVGRTKLPDDEEGLVWYNGDYGLYKNIRDGVEKGLSKIRSISGFEVPHPSLEGRTRYLAGWVRFISDLYECSNLPREIGYEVDCLAIPVEGETKVFRI